MTDETGGDQPQKTVAELLAQHGAQPEGGRRRRRRAVDDGEEAPAAPPQEPSHGRRRADPSDTAPQAIIDRVTADGGTPPPANRPPGRRARPQATPPQVPLPPQDVAPAPRQVPPEAAPLKRPPQPPSRQAPPPPPQESSQFIRPPQQESGHFARPPQQESGQYARPQESGQFVRPPQPPQESGQLPLPPRGRGPRPPQPPDGQETRSQIPPARRPAAPPPPPVQPPGALAARLDGLDGSPDEDVLEPPGLMASGSFAAPPVQPRRPRRPQARRPAPKVEPHTEQFAAVPDDVEPEQPEQLAPPLGEEPPAGLASWRKRRQKTQLDDTEVGVMPAVPADPEPEPEEFDAGPPTMNHPAPMPFAPARQQAPDLPPAHQDDLDEYEREFEDPRYAPSYANDGYAAQDDEYDYEDEAELGDEADVVDEDEEFEEAASPGKQWLALAGQLAAGVVGGAAVWLGFNWLWVNIPAAALVAALLVVVGLVWIVRKIRRAEDLQTTVLAVLVGLVVTVSPAALLLVSR